MSEITKALEAVHPDYTAQISEWRKAEDFASGIRAMRKHDISAWATGCATLYQTEAGAWSRARPAGINFVSIAQGAYILPTSDRMTYNEYVLYLLRGHCPSYVRLTLGGYLGLVFSAPPVVELPSGAEPLAQDADYEGTPLVEFVERVFAATLRTGRCGVLIDSPSEVPEGVSVAEAERAGIRPYAALYKAEDILDWRASRVGGRWVDSYFKLREKVRRGDGYDYDYRELMLDAQGYRQKVWTRSDSKGEYVSRTITPLKNGQPLRELPFYLYSPRGGRREIEPSPLSDLIELQHEYYQWAVEFANACFAVGIPTPAFLGFSDDEVANIVLGGLNAVWTTNPGADAKYLEFTGAGLDPLAARGVAILTNISKFGTRMLTQDKAAAEAEGTVRIRASGESATLADMARAASRITEQWLQFAIDWGFGGGKATFELATEYVDTKPDASLLKELREQVLDNLLGLSDFIRYQRKVNLIDDSRTDDEIRAELETQAEQSKAKTEAEMAARLAAVGVA